MSPRRRLAFLVLVALQAVVPLAMIGWNEVALATGEDVRLKTVPIDPIDLFRGRYVTLNYEISTLPTGGARAGDTVYVPLREAGDRWVGERATTQRPSEGTFIRGRVRGNGRIEYGIETYFADEEEARRLERETGREGLYVEVNLSDDGRARIEGVEPVR